MTGNKEQFSELRFLLVVLKMLEARGMEGEVLRDDCLWHVPEIMKSFQRIVWIIYARLSACQFLCSCAKKLTHFTHQVFISNTSSFIIFSLFSDLLSVADPRGARDACPLVHILSFSCRFWQKFCTLIGWCTLSGIFWIHHWLFQFFCIVPFFVMIINLEPISGGN